MPDLDPKKQVGGIEPFETDDPLVVLLYLLMRDHLHTGIFERLVVERAEAPRARLTNPFLASYAANLADRLRLLGAIEAGAALTEREKQGLSDCLEVARRIGSSYEAYGGIEVPEAVRAAQDALDRLDVPFEEVVG